MSPKRMPREVIAENRYSTASTAGSGRSNSARGTGEDMWLFTSDCPHGDGAWPEAVQQTVERPRTHHPIQPLIVPKRSRKQERVELRHGLARRRPRRHRIDGRPPHDGPAAAAVEAGEGRASRGGASRSDAAGARAAMQPLDRRPRGARAPRCVAAGGRTCTWGNGTSRRSGISCRSSPGYRRRPLRHDSGGVR